MSSYAFFPLKSGKFRILKTLRNNYQISRDWLQKPAELLIYILLAPVKKELGKSGASCMAGSVAAWGCCSAVDASMGKHSFAAVPGLMGASCLQRGCTTAICMHGCCHHVPLQSLCIVPITMHGCSHQAQLQSFCTAAILLHGCNHHAWLQSLCMAAILIDVCKRLAQLQSLYMSTITVHSCNPLARPQSPRMLQSLCLAAVLVPGCSHHAQLQCSCAAAILVRGCAAVALGRCKGIDYRALAARAEDSPMLSYKAAQHHPASPLGSGVAQEWLRSGLGRLWPAVV